MSELTISIIKERIRVLNFAFRDQNCITPLKNIDISHSFYDKVVENFTMIIKDLRLPPTVAFKVAESVREKREVLRDVPWMMKSTVILKN